jgi:TDG/mug DNA glycosylase family protein
MPSATERIEDFEDVAPTDAPLLLADVHRGLAVGSGIGLRARSGGDTTTAQAWDTDRLRDVVEGAGFTIDTIDAIDERHGNEPGLHVFATRARTLPDYVAPGLRVLFVGLNPSEYAADAGIGFARPGNRFWPAALAAGIVTRDRDPRDALVSDKVGMTDFVKRATPSAAALTRDEYRAGAARVERLVAWLVPATVCVVGLSGWRAARDRTAVSGWQPRAFGGRPVYVMPNTSGLNARVALGAFVEHLHAVSARVSRSSQ